MIAAEVFLWGTKIGTVSQENAADAARFNYDESFLNSGIEVAPLTMPLSPRVYSFPGLSEETFHGLPGLLADSLPDRFGNRLIEQHLAQQGRDPASFSAVERLCYTGKRGMGALEYVPVLWGSTEVQEHVDVAALTKLASDILSERKKLRIPKGDKAMEQILRVGTSAGGARAKAVIAWNEETGDIRSGQIAAGEGYSYWLIKFDGVTGNKDHGDEDDGPKYTRIEYGYYLMATAAGISMSRCRLYREGGRYHFLTKRFDRIGEIGDKLHMQTLGAMAHFDYNVPGENSYEQAAEVIYHLNMGQKEIEELYRRMIFNILANNRDDHVKNISFLMDRTGKWTLSPAYDITYAFDPYNRWTARHQMSAAGKTDDFTKADLMEAAAHMNISARRAGRIIGEVAGAVSRWNEFADEALLDKATTKHIAGTFLQLQ
ncbi:MAG: type II toxin-antitoxin system HipA family toxin [Lachnospiraceae bacterium]|nr:type II toxin-antitoxin system HipA family toxin [Lachnospiraceae bacterium]